METTSAATIRADATATPRLHALAWLSTRGLAIAVAVLVLALHLVVWGKAIEVRGGAERYVRSIDFLATITGAAVIRDRAGDDLYDIEVQRAAQARVRAPYLNANETQLLPYIHPPFEAALVAFLPALPLPLLYAGTTVAALLSLAGALWIMARALPLPAAARWPLILLALSYNPVHQALWLGQTSPFMLLGWCGAFALARRRDDWRAGALLALLALKPLFLPLPALLLALRWRPRAIAGLLGAILAASVAVMRAVGPLWVWRQWHFLRDIARLPQQHEMFPDAMPNLRGFIANLTGRATGDLVTPPQLALALLAGGLFLLACWWCRASWRGPEAAPVANDLLWALGAIVAVLLSPHVGYHDLTLLIFPLWIMAAHALAARRDRRQSRLWLAALWAVYLLPPLSNVLPVLDPIVITGTVALLGLAVALLAARIAREARAGGVAGGVGA